MAKKKKKPQRRAPKENKFPTGQASSLRGRQKKEIKPYIVGVIVVGLVLGGLVLGGLVLWYKKTAFKLTEVYPEAKRQEEAQIPLSAEEKYEAPLAEQAPETIDTQYISATFSDSFSSLAWLDTEETTLYFDWTGTNVLFPPDIAVEEITASPLLDTFVPELVKTTDRTIVFVGHHMLNDQKAVVMWKRDNDTWARMDFDTLGISQGHTIISVYSIPTLDQWFIFTQEENTARFHVYTFDAGMTLINDAGLGTIPQGVSLACGVSICLIYYMDTLEFFTLDTASLKLTLAPELQNMVRQKKFDSVVIQSTPPVILRSEATKDPIQQINKDKERWLIGLSQENAFEIWQYEPFASGRSVVSLLFSKSLEYPGHLALLPRSDGRVFILWASYFTRGYEMAFDGSVTDVSARFGWRISHNNPVTLDELDQAIYISNGDGTLVRFDGEINTRIDNVFWFNFTPSFLDMVPVQEHTGYMIAGVKGGGTKMYRFTDYGVDISVTRQAVSKQINFEVNKVGAAQISDLEASLSQANIQYYLSNDGGKTWSLTEPGQRFVFANAGNDLRWKIKIAPKKLADSYKTPYLRSIGLVYWYER
ncbi:hypothetical protein MYX07_05990 [Patescibacteria group bacterium AH-259-L07]|nr:hypothetical protein [Patescibacteria group bacterium AH-259-L07]